MDINGEEIGSPITLGQTFESNGFIIFETVPPITLPPNTSSLIIGGVSEIEAIELIF
ncbi:MAG: hypothetical protein AAGJ08_16365 [Cyanobacteria bacterium P01_H01_bin.35]